MTAPASIEQGNEVDEDHINIDLRPPMAVAERCIILAALIRRLWLESSFTSTNSEERSAEAFDLRESLRGEGTWDRLTPAEADYLQRPVGAATEDEIAVVAWQAEGLATLGWAIGLTDLLPPGDLGDVTAVIQAVPAPWDNTTEWLCGTRLRSEEEIATERDRAEILEWRIAVESPSRVATGQELADYVAAIDEVVQEARAAGLLGHDAGADFSIGDRPLATFDDYGLERLGALAEERLRALNWLCGYGTTWDDVPLDV